MRLPLLLISITLITYSSALRAQPILTQSDISFQIGDSFTFDSIQYIDLSAQTGANMVWDLSSLPVYDTYSSMTVIPIGDTPSSALHPGSTIGTQVDIAGQTLFQYFDNSASGMDFYGTSADFGGINFESIYSNPELAFPFPLIYNSSGSDTYSQSTDLSGNESISTGVINWTVPGYGALMFNGQTYEDVLMYQFQRLDTNVVSFGGVTFSTFSDDVTYAFFAAGYRYPIAIFSELQSNSDFEPVTTTFEASYLFSQTTGLDDISDILPDLNVFPNPVSTGVLTLEYSLDDPTELSMEIMDLSGRVILTTPSAEYVGQVSQRIHLPAELEAGMYLLNFRSEDGNRTVPLVVN